MVVDPVLEKDAGEAQAFVEKECPGDGVFSVCTEWYQGVPVIVVRVPKKKAVGECENPVPKYVRRKRVGVAGWDGWDGDVRIRTKVIEQEEFRSYELRPNDSTTRVAVGHDKVYNKIIGGLQIAPDGANWVGTLGGLYMATVGGSTVYGALTNAHVTGLHASPGLKMMQPSPSYQRGAFGLVRWVSPFSKTEPNLMDAAILDCDIDKGYWEGNRRWTVHPEQFGVGALSLRWKDPVVGMRVIKTGRTTGVTRGVCTATNATDSVNYGEDGVFGFIKQAHFKGNSGDLSGPGDSGSFILEESTMDVVSHLFAGGGGVTIGYWIRSVIEATGGRFSER